MVHLRRSSPSAAAGAGAHPFPCRKVRSPLHSFIFLCFVLVLFMFKSILLPSFIFLLQHMNLGFFSSRCRPTSTYSFFTSQEDSKNHTSFWQLVFVNRENDIILLDDDDPWQFRWINYLGPDIKRGHFTNEEEENIIKLHEIGNSS
ncbi:hypothetical protein P8452_16730 [Trifolium repens]|nr:hypothetical protein P8452_16730 [Trifolium repens]